MAKFSSFMKYHNGANDSYIQSMKYFYKFLKQRPSKDLKYILV